MTTNMVMRMPPLAPDESQGGRESLLEMSTGEQKIEFNEERQQDFTDEEERQDLALNLEVDGVVRFSDNVSEIEKQDGEGDDDQ